MFERVVHYQTKDGKAPFQEWFLSFKDARVNARILARIDRLFHGNFGDCKSVGKSVFELRFHFGSGYRVYFGIDRQVIVVLLLGGDKSTQKRDIHCSQAYWTDYLRRAHESGGRSL